MGNRNTTPLRYPGGKSVFTEFFASYVKSNRIEDPIYIEPYCGGAGAAINLILEGHVSEIWLNDANYSIYSFWYSLKHYGEDFLNLLHNVDISLSEWKIQREIFLSEHNKSHSKSDLLANGFATFFLNRSNRSGILKAGPIGGRTEERQEQANYKIDARFNRSDLIQRIKQIVHLSEKITVTNLDALELLNHISNSTQRFQSRCFIYLDPPYYVQGSSLYMNFYKHDDHEEISKFLNSEEFSCRWLLSYDNVSSIRRLYSDLPQYSFYLNYSAQESKLGSELLIHSKNSVLPDSLIVKELSSNKKRIELVKVD